jgi:hypothetical protein
MQTLTENEIKAAFNRTNSAEPLSEGWPGLLRFAREIERVVTLPLGRRLGAPCSICNNVHALDDMETVMCDFDRKLHWQCKKQPCL